MVAKDFEFVVGKSHRSVLMGLAIVWVTMHHFALYSPKYSSVFAVFAQGSSGVDIFFFLSVFGLCFSYTSNNLMVYYQRRLQRLFPMYFIFIFLWYIGCRIFDIPIGNIRSMIINTLTCLSCISNMSTGTDIIEWYIPAQLFIYLSFPLIFIGIKKVASLRTRYIVVVFITVVLFGMLLSHFASRPLYLRLPVLFIGILTFMTMGGVKINFSQLSYYQQY